MPRYATRSYRSPLKYPPARIGHEKPRLRLHEVIQRQRLSQLELIAARDPTYLQIIAKELDPGQGWLDRAREQLVDLESRGDVLREEAWRRGRRTSQQEREMRQREQIIDEEDREAAMRSSIARNGEERRTKLRPKRRIMRFQDITPPETIEQVQTATLLLDAVQRALSENGKEADPDDVSQPVVDTTALHTQEPSYMLIADEIERMRTRHHWVEVLAAEMNACEAYDVENGIVCATPTTYGPHCIEAWAAHIAELETRAFERWGWHELENTTSQTDPDDGVQAGASALPTSGGLEYLDPTEAIHAIVEDNDTDEDL